MINTSSSENPLPEQSVQPNETPTSQQDIPPDNVQQSTVASTAPPQKSRRLLVIGGCISLAALCLCASVICVSVFGSTLYQAIIEKDNIVVVVDKFMMAMVNKNPDQAYALFSTRVQRQFPVSRLEDMVDGSNYSLFDGYVKAEVVNVNITRGFNTNPDAPQGLVAKVDGTVTYEGGYTGSFQAVLEQENDEWALFSINVIIPPDKLEEFINNHP